MAGEVGAVRVGLCGLGTVGAGTLKVLHRNQEAIDSRAGCGITITHIGARRDNPSCETGDIKISRDIFAVAEDPDVDVLVELIGGCDTAFDLIMRAIAQGKHVVTANKALIAEHGNEIFRAASEKGVSVVFEAAVAGGIPIIKALREGLSANQVNWIAGIINGTGNFILTEMRDKARDFDDVLKEAQALGYAEADPTFDVEGIDAAHKLVILSALAFGVPIQFDSCYTEGISSIEPQDVAYASELGYRIKHLGIARRTAKGIEQRVHPALVPEKRLLANVDGVMNAVVVNGDAVGSTLYYGAGAGAEPTASAVIADVVDTARLLTASPEHRVPALAFQQTTLSNTPILSIDEVETAYYLRLSALDRPGVLSKITQIVSEAGISIEAIIQKEPLDGSASVPVIMMTNVTVESKLNLALERIGSLSEVVGKVTRIRVESLAD